MTDQRATLTPDEREALLKELDRPFSQRRPQLIAAVERIVAERAGEAAERALLPLDLLFSGGPDTSCRTTRPDGIECVEVPLDDLRAAFTQGYAEVMRYVQHD